MKDTKDNFSTQSGKYAKYRPSYPHEMYDYLFSLVEDKCAAWDCGTGNGQVAIELSAVFQKVFATDISEQQIKNATPRENIFYSVGRAEENTFPDNKFGLITVAQAIHWFDFDNFYSEVYRTILPNGIFAVIGYGLVRADDSINRVIDNFYHDVIGPYWDKERKYIDDNYQTIPFPFSETAAPVFRNIFEWTLDELTGYIETWSAVQHYIKTNNADPVPSVKAQLKEIWGQSATREIQFPILLRIAKINK